MVRMAVIVRKVVAIAVPMAAIASPMAVSDRAISPPNFAVDQPGRIKRQFTHAGRLTAAGSKLHRNRAKPATTFAMELVARTRIVLWEGGSLWAVDARPEAERTIRSTDSHAHHALQIVISLGGTFRLSTADGSVENAPVVVAADVAHWFEAEGRVALAFVEPESRLGRAISERLDFEGGMARVPADVVGDFAAEVAAATDPEALAAAGRALHERMAGDVRAGLPDFRVRRVLAWAQDNLETAGGLAEAAAVAGLSPGRLRHLFVEQTGLPFKTYLLWLRMTRAVTAISAGASLTQAAHEAGFADSPHFSRTFRRMFGIAPASLQMT